MYGVRFGKLSIVDLAGSERLKNTQTTDPTALKEAGAINRSLFALGQVGPTYLCDGVTYIVSTKPSS